MVWVVDQFRWLERLFVGSTVMHISTWAQPPNSKNFLRSLRHFPHLGEAHVRRLVDLARAALHRHLGPEAPEAPEADPPDADELGRGASEEWTSPSLGELLRQAREASGRSLGEASAGLRIRRSHLQALEAGAYEELPAPAYAMGFIRSYAAYLGLDSVDMVRRFKRETEGQHLAPELGMPVPVRERRIAGAGVLLGLALLGVCGYAALHFLSSGGEDRPNRVAPVPPAQLAPPGEPAPAPVPATAETAALMPASEIESLSARSPAAGPSPPLLQAGPDPGASRATEPPPLEARAASAPLAAAADPAHLSGVSGDGGSRITLRVTAETWLEVKDGATSIFRRLMEAGDEYRLPDKPGLVMRVGNARGIEVLVDGKPLPSAAQPSQGHRVLVTLEARELLARAGTQ